MNNITYMSIAQNKNNHEEKDKSCAHTSFTKFTVKTVIPGRPIMDKLLSLPKDALDWLKIKIFTPLSARVIILFTQTNTIDIKCKHEKKLMANKIKKVHNELKLNIAHAYTNKKTTSDDVVLEITKAIIEFEKKVIQHYQNTLINNTNLSCTDKIKLVATLKVVLKEYLEKEIDSTFLKYRNLGADKSLDTYTKVLKESLEAMIRLLNKEHTDILSELPNTVCPSSDGYNNLGLSEKSVAILRNECNKQYRCQIEQNAENNDKVKISGDKESVTVPSLFAAEVKAGKYILSSPTTEGESDDTCKEYTIEALIEKLQTMTKDKKAIYTICSHLSHSIASNMDDTIHEFIKNSLSLDCDVLSNRCERSVHIDKDPNDENKIIITHNLVIQQQKDSMESNNHHDKNPSPPPVKHGPDSLQVKCINDDSICYLSSYKKDWLHSRIEHSVKITVDLNSPDRATVEQKGPFIHLPTE